MSSALQLTRLTLDLTRSEDSDTLNSNTIRPITSEMIQNLSIMDEDISANAGISGSKIANGTITSAKIANGTILTEDISDGQITSAKIANGTILTEDISNGQVTGTKIAASTISISNMANVGGQTFQQYLDNLRGLPGTGTITSAMIANGTILTEDISDGQITSAKIANGTILTVDISDAQITYNKLNSNITSLITTLTNDLTALTIRVSNLEVSGWYGTIRFTFNANSATDFVLNIPGYASGVSINNSTNTWTLPIGSRLATTSTVLPPINIYTVYSYIITSSGFVDNTIILVNSPSYGFLIPTNLYNTTIVYNLTTVRD